MKDLKEIRSAGDYWQFDYEVKPVFIKTVAGVASAELPDKSILQKNKKVIGLAVVAPGSGKKNEAGLNLINSNAYNCAYLVLRSDATTERIKLRLETLAYRTGGDNFFLRLPFDDIDIANSVIVFGDITTVVANEVVQIDFYYERC